ncbi:MAG: hypothetical protein H6Q32_393 [Bacteroidetes bacterium]|nr:hypothetical protein [Bacteroidota bacterium]
MQYVISKDIGVRGKSFFEADRAGTQDPPAWSDG